MGLGVAVGAAVGIWLRRTNVVTVALQIQTGWERVRISAAYEDVNICIKAYVSVW